MQKLLKSMTLAVLLVSGMISVGNAQKPAPDLLNRVDILGIRRIQAIGTYYLDMTLELKNKSSEKLKISHGDFKFYLGVDKQKGMMIGTDKFDTGREDIILETEHASEITFHIFMGEDQNKVFYTLVHVLNCIGNPTKTTPFLTIEGEFRLAVYDASKNGWNYSPMQVEWNFIPDFKKVIEFVTPPSK